MLWHFEKKRFFSFASSFNLFVTSKNEITNSPIHEFKVLHKGQRAFYSLSIIVYYFLSYFKKHFKPCFFILKALKDPLQHFKFVNWWIRGFVFLMSRTGYIVPFWNASTILQALQTVLSILEKRSEIFQACLAFMYTPIYFLAFTFSWQKQEWIVGRPYILQNRPNII